MNGQKKGRLSNGQMMTMALRQLLQNVHGLKSKKAPKQSPISPKSIANSISLIDGSNRGYKFRPGRQEDAHEFLVHLLDAMHDGELAGAGMVNLLPFSIIFEIYIYIRRVFF
jgi:ubiquitin C-terminal hydrolase